jgi:hypothetical protein
MRSGAIDLDLLEHGEAHAVVLLAERADLFGRAGLLGAELVAWKAEHHQAALAILSIERLETFVLRVKPHLLAVFTTSNTLPAKSRNATGVPSSLLAEKP